MSKRLLLIFFVLFLGVLITPGFVQASYDYYIPITVSNNDTSSFSGLPVLVTLDNSQLASLGYIEASGLDTNVLEGSSSISYSMSSGYLPLFIESILGTQSRTYYYRLGESTPQTSFPVITGYGGYATVADSAALELGDTFNLTYNGWVETNLPDPGGVGTNGTSELDTGTSTNHVVDLPSSYAAGDLLIIFFMGTNPGGDTPVASCSGWTQLGQLSTASNCYASFYKVAAGTEGSNITITTDDVCYSTHMSIQIDENNYLGLPQATIGQSGGASHPDSPPLNMGEGSMKYITAYMGRDSVTVAISSPPTGYTIGGYHCGDSVPTYGYLGVGFAYKDTIEWASENPGAFTMTSALSYWGCITIGIETPIAAAVAKPEAIYLYSPNNNDDFVATISGSHYYYDEGEYEDDWVVGYSTGAGSQSKESDHLYLLADYVASSAERTYVLDSAVNLTNVDTLYVDWENIDGDYVYLVVSTDKTSHYNVYDYRYGHTVGGFSRETNSLDVSGASGNYYIRVHARGTFNDAELLVYGVYAGDLAVNLVASGIDSGEYLVNVWGNGTSIGLDLDGVTEDSVSGVLSSVTDNSNSWVISPPMVDYYKHYVNDTLKAWYQPVAMISGTTLPDRSGNGHTGAITWGSNPASISVELGGIQPFASFVIPGGGNTTIPEVLPPAGSIPTTSSSGATGEGLPLYVSFKNAGDSLGWTVPTTYMVFFIIISIAMGVVGLLALRTWWGFMAGFGAFSAFFGQVTDIHGYRIVPMGITIMCILASVTIAYLARNN